MIAKVTGYIDVPDNMPDPDRYILANKSKISDITSEPAEPGKSFGKKHGDREYHPSYGTVSISRTSGGEPSLFGSSILHDQKISIRLSTASIERSLHYDTVMPEKLIAEIEMSQSQFADMITSMNIGGGTPCTIRWLRGTGSVEPCPFVDKRRQFEKELSENIDGAGETAQKLIQDAQEMLSRSKPMTKAEKESLLSALSKLSTEIGSNRKFIYASFNEQMDATVKEAKGEVEAFMQGRILRAAGIDIENRGRSPVDMATFEQPAGIETDSMKEGSDA